MGKFDLRVILVVIGVLILVTGIVTENLKKILWQVIPTSLLSIILAEVFTLGSGLIYALFSGVTVLWWHVVAAVVAGYIVACITMFSYEKFIEIRLKTAEKFG